MALLSNSPGFSDGSDSDGTREYYETGNTREISIHPETAADVRKLRRVLAVYRARRAALNALIRGNLQAGFPCRLRGTDCATSAQGF